MFFEVFSQAMDSIKANKMRTFLTMLGVVIGVAAVIIIFTTGNAGKVYINNLFGKLGANIISVQLDNSKDIEDSDVFSMKDVEFLEKNIPEINKVQYYASGTGGTKINYGTKSKYGQIMGVTPDIYESRPIELTSGRLISSSDVDAGSSVAVIPDMCVKTLFGSFNPLGKKIILQDDDYGSRTFTIVGTIDFDIGIDMSMAADDMPVVMIMIPFSAFQSYYETDEIRFLELSTPTDVDYNEVVSKAKMYLELLHNNEDKYTFTSSQSIQDTVNTIINVVQIAILAIGAISLVVGGIGIMNIMLVAVTERTREIGIRKAIGAQKKDIIVQFLFEAILLTLMSGVVGMIIGILPAFPLASLVKCSPAELISPTILLVSIGAAILCGVFFGVYPAKKAAELDPIESLRYE